MEEGQVAGTWTSLCFTPSQTSHGNSQAGQREVQRDAAQDGRLRWKDPRRLCRESRELQHKAVSGERRLRERC